MSQSTGELSDLPDAVNLAAALIPVGIPGLGGVLVGGSTTPAAIAALAPKLTAMQFVTLQGVLTLQTVMSDGSVVNASAAPFVAAVVAAIGGGGTTDPTIPDQAVTDPQGNVVTDPQGNTITNQ